jgi:hypothetical protein
VVVDASLGLSMDSMVKTWVGLGSRNKIQKLKHVP